MIRRTLVIRKGKTCNNTHDAIQKITYPVSSKATEEALHQLRGKYPQLKLKQGVDFHFLDRTKFSLPMMIKLGVPVHEIIIGRISKEGGLRKLLAEVVNISHSNGPAHKRLNFRTLVDHGVPLHTLLENHVPVGLLIHDGFTKEELMHEGISEHRFNTIIDSHKSAPNVFGKKRT